MIERQKAPLDPEYSVAKKALYDLLDSKELFDLLDERKISQEADDTPPYWRAVSDVAEYLYPETDDETSQNSLNRLTLTAPYHAFAKYTLKHKANERVPAVLKNHLKETASRFNRDIRTAAELNSSLSARQLHGHLSSVIDMSIQNEAVIRASADILRGCINGARHEIGFGQIATAAGLDALETDVAQDLKGGDWRLRDEASREITVDTKAALGTLRVNGAGDRPYVILPNGNVMMHSLIQDEEFGDRMYISDELAAAKAPKLRRYFDEIMAVLSLRRGARRLA